MTRPRRARHVATFVNCSLWVSSGFLREKWNWSIVIANEPGITLGPLAFLTAL